MWYRLHIITHSFSISMKFFCLKSNGLTEITYARKPSYTIAIANTCMIGSPFRNARIIPKLRRLMKHIV